MDPKLMGELIVRIDERTANIAKRQEEEIKERKDLSNRLDILESWKNKLVGAYVLLAGAVGVAAKVRHQ